jgi:hypothetical protein
MKTSRTGLALDADLYRLAVKRAESEGRSFAAYVTDLIAIDLIDAEGAEKVVTIQRMRANRRRMAQGAIEREGPVLKSDAEFIAEKKEKHRTHGDFLRATSDPTLNEEQAGYDTTGGLPGQDKPRSRQRKTGT